MSNSFEAFDLVLPPVPSDHTAGAPLYNLHVDNEDQVIYARVPYKKSEWESITKLRDETVDYVLKMDAVPESDFILTDIGCDAPVGTKSLQFHACKVPNKAGAHAFRMKAVLPSWDPDQLTALLNEPRNTIDYSINNWGTVCLTEDGETKIVYSKVTGFDSVVEDLCMLFHRFQRGNVWFTYFLTFEHRACPPRPGVNRIKNCITYVRAERLASGGTELVFCIERKEPESYNTEPQAMMLSLKGVLFYQFMLTYLSCMRNKNIDEVKSVIASRSVVRHAVRAAAYINTWKLLHCHEDMQIYCKRCSVTNNLKLTAKSMIFIDKPISQVVKLLRENPLAWFSKAGLQGQLAHKQDNDRMIYDVTIPASATVFGKERWMRVATCFNELTVNNYIVAMTSVKAKLSETRDLHHRIEMEPSAFFVHAMGPDKTFVMAHFVFNMDTLPLDLNPTCPPPVIQSKLGQLSETLRGMNQNLKETCETGADPSRGLAEISDTNISSIQDVIKEQQEHIQACLNVMMEQENELRELYGILTNANKKRSRVDASVMSTSSHVGDSSPGISAAQDGSSKRMSTRSATRSATRPAYSSSSAKSSGI